MRNLPLVYRASGKFWVNNHAHILKPKDGNNYDFLAYALEAGDYNTYITGAAQGRYMDAYEQLFLDADKYKAIQRALADRLYRELHG